MAVRTSLLAVVVAFAFIIGAVATTWGDQPADPSPDRLLDVEVVYLQGHASMTVFYVVDHRANKLHIYRAAGGPTATLNEAPRHYATVDLSSAGEQELAVTHVEGAENRQGDVVDLHLPK